MTDKKLKMIGYSDRKKATPASSKKLKQAYAAIILGLLLIPGGLLVTNVIQGLIDDEIADFIKTPKPSDEGYNDWLSDDHPDAIPMYTSFYMQNLTNPQETCAGEKPIFTEIGPYTYRVYSYKYDVSFNDDYSEVTYKSYSRYVYLPELSGSGLSTDDYISNINPGYLGVLDLMKDLNPSIGPEENLVRAMFPSVLAQVKSMFQDMILEMVGPLGGALPPAEEIFFWDWAEDNFPHWGGIFEFLLRPMAKDLIDENGVDIDGILYESTGWMGEADDLSIIDSDVDLPTDLANNLTKCQDLWESDNPLSLTGMDVMENPIWFDAADNPGGAAYQTLLDTFYLTPYQLMAILDWLLASIDENENGWLRNVCIKQISDWESDLITNRKVEEWLFTGVDVLINNVDPSMAKVGIFTSCESEWESEFYGASSSTFNTGQTNINDIGQYVKYNGESTITVWDPDVEVSGTGGTQFAPGVTNDERLEIFIPEFLRPLELVYSKDVTVKGVSLLRYILPDDAFTVGEYEDDKAGLANMQVSYGAPVYLGQPHFFGADPSLLDDVVITPPNQDEHQLYIDVEPNTGATMAAKLRMAINLKVEQTDFWYQTIKSAIYPIFWLEQSAEIPDDLASMFKDLVYMVLDIKEYLYAGFVGGGAALLSLGIVVTTTQRRKQKQKKLEKFEMQKKEFFKYKHELQKYKESKMALPQTIPKKKKLESTK